MKQKHEKPNMKRKTDTIDQYKDESLANQITPVILKCLIITLTLDHK